MIFIHNKPILWIISFHTKAVKWYLPTFRKQLDRQSKLLDKYKKPTSGSQNRLVQ
jgi:hypothetical protein